MNFLLMIRRGDSKADSHIDDYERDGRTMEEELGRLVSIWDRSSLKVEIFLLEPKEFFDVEKDRILIWENSP